MTRSPPRISPTCLPDRRSFAYSSRSAGQAARSPARGTRFRSLVGSSIAVGAKPVRTTYKLKAALNIGQEKPIPKGTKLGASGRFTATLNGTALTWKLTFKHLSGAATAAHIHIGARKVAGPVVVPLCTPCTSPVSGAATLTADQVKDVLAGKYYANVHTAQNPGGEIRGQIKKAPTAP